MFKFTAAVVLLLVGSSLAEMFDEIKQFDETEKFEGTQDFDEPKAEQSVDEIGQEFDENQDWFDDNDQEFDDNQDFDESQAEFEEVLGKNVKPLDAARAALLEFARSLREGKNATNTFLKLIDGFEKRIADFQATLGRRPLDPGFVDNVKRFIQEASENRNNTIFLQSLTAQGLFAAQSSEGGSTLAKRDNLLVQGALAFLESVKEDIGEESFEEFLSVRGTVTLIFVIDDTGSMRGEIDAAIAIAEQIVGTKREEKVDFILSPFNDPSK